MPASPSAIRYLYFRHIRTDLSFVGRSGDRRYGCDWRPVRSLKMKKPSGSDKAANEGIQRFHSALTERSGLILLFDGEVGSAGAEPRRAQLNRYPDFGRNLAPAFPVPHLRLQWHGGSLYPVTVAQPSPICTGFPDNSCDVSKSWRPSYAFAKFLQTKFLARPRAEEAVRGICQAEDAELHRFALIYEQA